MSDIYDNWERIVAATLRREQLRQLCLAHSREPSSISLGSQSSDFSWPSPLPTVQFDSWQNNDSALNINGFESHVLLAAEKIIVNGESLSPEKLNSLLSCPHPPKKLKPGHYWYDKVSGVWGKQGHKPSQIISPCLNVGGRLDKYASNGNTRISINGRQITKREQLMLKFAGVKCRPDTHIWMDEHGSYKFEGQNYVSGCIWDKVGMKLLCAVLSLPFPPKSSNYTSGLEQSGPPCHEQNGIQKLLLIGCDGSGTSAIFKKAVEILQLDCKPYNVDTDHITSSIRLSYLDFSFPESAYDDDDDAESGDLHDSLRRFQLIRLQVKDFEECSMWLPLFEDVQIVLFCVSLCDYDQFSFDGVGNTVNKMILSKRFFEKMVTHPTFDKIDFLLILNKFNLFEEKIRHVPLSQCDWFDDFRPVSVYSGSMLGQFGFHYIAAKFKRLYLALTSRKLYVSLVSSLELDSVDAALKYARAILNWDKERHKFSLSGYSSYTDQTSLSD